MVFVLKPEVTKAQIDEFILQMEAKGFSTIISTGTEHTVVCLIGNTAAIDMDHIAQTNNIVEYGKRVTEPYKAVNRMVHHDDSLISIGDVTIGEV